VRLFVAVWPPPPVVAELARLPRPETAGVRWTTSDQWHVTLRFLGEVGSPDGLEASLRAATLPAADAALGSALRRLGQGVLCVDVGGLDLLAQAVIGATAAIGRPPEARPFHGHLTVARASRRGSELRALAGSPVGQLTFQVRAVAVVRSHLGRSGARYETLTEVACHE
jgi:2'-5' RNA ligase